MYKAENLWKMEEQPVDSNMQKSSQGKAAPILFYFLYFLFDDGVNMLTAEIGLQCDDDEWRGFLQPISFIWNKI